MTNEDKQTITGELNRVIYQNDNNFIIGAFQGGQGPFTAIGTLINPQVNMEYTLTGTWEENARYGLQFKFSRYETVRPTDPNGIFKYIVRQCKFVGSTVGNRLMEAYGDQTLNIMKNNPDQVASDIPGLTLKRARKIQKTLIENEMDEAVMVELEALLDVPGMRKSLVGDLIAEFGNNAGDMIRGNPYTLTAFPGIGFAMADRVALNVGYPRDGVARKTAATMHALREVMTEGSIWIERDELMIRVKELIQVTNLGEGLDVLIDDGIVTRSYDGLIAFSKPAKDECRVAEMLVALEVAA